jgi:hypothetical protein
MKSKLLILFTLLICFTIISCDKEEFQLGDYSYNLKVDSVYQAMTDGFVVVNVSSNGSAFKASLLSDEKVNPTTELASVIWDGGSMTAPIKKGSYWKVIHNNINVDQLKISISWAPLEYK